MCALPFQQYRPTHLYCESCKKERAKQRWEKWRSKQDDASFRAKENERQQGYRLRTGYQRDYELRTKYGITLEEWADMLEKAGYACEICRQSTESLCVDHDHVTGKVRGVLCRKCNRSIGQLGDSVEALERALEYLRRTT